MVIEEDKPHFQPTVSSAILKSKKVEKIGWKEFLPRGTWKVNQYHSFLTTWGANAPKRVYSCQTILFTSSSCHLDDKSSSRAVLRCAVLCCAVPASALAKAEKVWSIFLVLRAPELPSQARRIRHHLGRPTFSLSARLSAYCSLFSNAVWNPQNYVMCSFSSTVDFDLPRTVLCRIIHTSDCSGLDV